MVKIKPFKAFLPNVNYVNEIICPPYDVIDYEESKNILNKKGKKSFIRIIRSEVDFIEEIHPYSEEVYLKAKKNLEEFIQNQYLIQEKEEVFFIYQLEWNHHKQAGIVGLSHIDDYLTNKIKKHEFTRPDKEEDRFKHIDITGFNCEPVFFTFKSEDHPLLENLINTIVSKNTFLIFDVTDDYNVKHRIFKLKDEYIQQIIKYFKELSCIYIADGHHRTASTVRAALKRKEKDSNYHSEKSYNYFLSVIFPSQQLKILPYNRMVKDLHSYSVEEFLDKIQEKFFISKSRQPLNIHEFNMYIEKEWYHLKLKKEYFRNGDIEDLDVSYLQDYILDPILGIKDPRTSDRISFVGGIKGEEEIEKMILTKNWKVGFSLYPTPMNALFRVADAGKVMPPKSTWFEPKLKSGFFLYKIEE